MNAKLSVVLFLTLLIKISSAQQAVITGIVSANGIPIHYAFIHSLQSTDAVYTDSTGAFTIKGISGTALKVTCNGYSDTTVTAATGSLMIFLKQAASDRAVSNSPVLNTGGTIATRPVSAMSEGDLLALTAGGDLIGSVKHIKGNTRGNRYLFYNFVNGYIITPANTLIQNSKYHYDYDKIGGTFLVTDDNKSITQISENQIKDVILYDNTDHRFVFEKVPAADKIRYVQVLASGSKYEIIKLTKTNFVKADYVTNGITSHGNDYDEYVDDATYFVMDAQTKQLQKLSLKKKSLKEDFAKDADRLNKFISANSGDIDDAYLSKLGDYLNN